MKIILFIFGWILLIVGVGILIYSTFLEDSFYSYKLSMLSCVFCILSIVPFQLIKIVNK